MPFLSYSSSVWLTDVWDLTFHNTPRVYNEVPLTSPFTCNKNNSVYKKKRIVTDRNICKIISELEKTEWDEILNSYDVNVTYETFVNKLTDIYIYIANIGLLSPVR